MNVYLLCFIFLSVGACIGYALSGWINKAPEDQNFSIAVSEEVMRRIDELSGGIVVSPRESFCHSEPNRIKEIIENGFHKIDTLSAAFVLQEYSHGCARASGWWTDIETMKDIDPTDLNLRGMKYALIHSEISEALEGMRKNKNDEHLPQHKNEFVELADAIIRIFDYTGALKVDMGQIIYDKMKFNATRKDHKIESRLQPDGKKF